MGRRLRAVELEFTESAPLRLSLSAEVSAPPEAVYASLAEEVADWPRWFTAVTAAEKTEAGRRIRLRGGVYFEETVMAANAATRYAYRIDVTNAPGVTAMLEEWRLSPSGTGGTAVRWTMAVAGPAPVLAVLKQVRRGLGRSFRGSLRNLERRLAAAGP